jgi:hypothetical protein
VLGIPPEFRRRENRFQEVKEEKRVWRSHYEPPMLIEVPCHVGYKCRRIVNVFDDLASDYDVECLVQGNSYSIPTHHVISAPAQLRGIRFENVQTQDGLRAAREMFMQPMILPLD